MVSGPAEAGSRGEHGAGREPQLRLVGTYLDGDLALDPMGTADPCDYELHLSKSPVIRLRAGDGPVALPGPSRLR